MVNGNGQREITRRCKILEVAGIECSTPEAICPLRGPSFDEFVDFRLDLDDALHPRIVLTQQPPH